MIREYVAELERSELERIAREGIRRVRGKGNKVSRDLEREVKEAAATTPSFALGTFGQVNGCRCLIGEVRFRRGEPPAKPNRWSDPAEFELGIAFDELVSDAVAVAEEYGDVKIV